MDVKKRFIMTFEGLNDIPKNIVSFIKTGITSLKKSTRFIDYKESSHFATKIDQLRLKIVEDLSPKYPSKAIDLLIYILDLHPTTLERVDDSGGVVGDVFVKVCADLGEIYAAVNTSLEDIIQLVFDRFMNNHYCICDNIILYFKTVLGSEGLNLLEQKLKQSLNSKNIGTIGSGLKQIADCQDDVNAYISACSFNTQISTREHLEIAERFIKHSQGEEAIKWLNSMDLSDAWFSEDKRKGLKIQALELCGNYKEAQEERRHWFEATLSPKVYKEILEHAEVDFIGSFRKVAIQTALGFSDPHAAITFLVDIQDFEHLTKLILLKSNILDGSKYYILRPVAEALHEIDPLAATLVHRKMIEPILVNTKSRYYNYAAKDLVTCGILSSKVTDWQHHKNHESYLRELSTEHKRKRSFWERYQSRIDKQKQKEVKKVQKLK